MTVVFIIFHTIVCICLVTIILMQSGRGGGLTEAFASAESVFGAKTNEFLIKGTTIFASFFLVTCLVLAFLNVKRNQSIMPKQVAAPSEKDAEKVVQQIIDEAKKNTVVLDGKGQKAPVQADQAAPAVQAEPVQVPAANVPDPEVPVKEAAPQADAPAAEVPAATAPAESH